MIIADIERKAGVLAMMLIMGFGAGYWTKMHVNDAGLLKQETKAIKTSAATVVKAAEKSQQVETSIQQSDTQIDQLKDAALARIKEKQNAERIRPGSNDVHAGGPDHDAATAQAALAAVPECAGADHGGDALDFGTVRLLNRARNDASLDAGAGGAGQGPTAPAAR